MHLNLSITFKIFLFNLLKKILNWKVSNYIFHPLSRLCNGILNSKSKTRLICIRMHNATRINLRRTRLPQFFYTRLPIWRKNDFFIVSCAGNEIEIRDGEVNRSAECAREHVNVNKQKWVNMRLDTVTLLSSWRRNWLLISARRKLATERFALPWRFDSKLKGDSSTGIKVNNCVVGGKW